MAIVKLETRLELVRNIEDISLSRKESEKNLTNAVVGVAMALLQPPSLPGRLCVAVHHCQPVLQFCLIEPPSDLSSVSTLKRQPLHTIFKTASLMTILKFIQAIRNNLSIRIVTRSDNKLSSMLPVQVQHK